MRHACFFCLHCSRWRDLNMGGYGVSSFFIAQNIHLRVLQEKRIMHGFMPCTCTCTHGWRFFNDWWRHRWALFVHCVCLAFFLRVRGAARRCGQAWSLGWFPKQLHLGTHEVQIMFSLSAASLSACQTNQWWLKLCSVTLWYFFFILFLFLIWPIVKCYTSLSDRVAEPTLGTFVPRLLH